MDYTAPPTTGIPFTFGSSGYSPLDATAVNFTFSSGMLDSLQATLSADVVVDGLYHDEAYTYLKGRQKYIVGYESPGKVKIVYGRDEYGGIRDFRSFVKGVYTSEKDLLSNIFGEIIYSELTGSIEVGQLYYDHAYTYVKQCKDYIIGYGPDGIQVISVPCLYGGIRDLRYSAIGVYSSTSDLFYSLNVMGISQDIRDIQAYAKACRKLDSTLSSSLKPTVSSSDDIHTYLNSILNKGFYDLNNSISVHNYQEIGMSIKSWGHQINDLNTTLITQLTKSNKPIYSDIWVHLPKDISSHVSILQVGQGDLYSNLYAELLKGFLDLSMYVELQQPTNLYGQLSGVPPSHLLSNLKGIGHQQELLNVYLNGDLNKGTFMLPSELLGIQPTFIKSSIKGIAHGVNLIEASLYGEYIGGVRTLFFRILADTPKNIRGSVKGVGNYHSDINSYLNTLSLKGEDYLYFTIELEKPIDIKSSLKPVVKDMLNLNMFLTSELFKGNSILHGTLRGEPFRYIRSSIKGMTFGYSSVDAYLNTVLFKGVYDLHTTHGGHLPEDLYAHSEAHLPLYLYGYVHGFDEKYLLLSTHGWDSIDLSLYAGINIPSDISSTIRATYKFVMKSIPAYLNSVLKKGSLGVGGVIGTHDPVDIFYSLTAIWFKGEYNLQSIISTDLPRNLSGYLHTFQTEVSYITSEVSGHTPLYLYSNIGGHTPQYLPGSIRGFVTYDVSGDIQYHLPVDLGKYIFAYQYREFPSSIYGWQQLDINSSIDKHLPANITAYLNMFQHSLFDLTGSAYGWDLLNLKFNVEGTSHINSISSSMFGVFPGNLKSYLKVWPSNDIGTSLHSWDTYNISGYIYMLYTSPIYFYIGGHEHVDLSFRVKGSGFIEKDLPIYARVFQWRYLTANLFTFDLRNLSSFLFPITSRNINSNVYGWDERFLNFYLNVRDYPWNLTASITGYGGYYVLNFSVNPVKAHLVFANLQSYVESYAYRDISYYMYCISGYNLSAFIEADMGAKNLRAYIRPDVVRMTKIIGVMTMELKNLTAMINVSCFSSNFNYITAYIKSIYLSNLNCVLYGKEYVRDYKDLACTVGYDHTYIVHNKLPINITVINEQRMVMDRLNIIIQVRGGYSYLSSYVRGVPIQKELSAYIKGMYVPNYVFDKSMNRVKQYKIDPWTNRPQLNQIIEITFKEAVREYTYIHHANKVYSNDILDVWITKMRSFLPAHTALGLKRRLNKTKLVDAINTYKDLDTFVRDVIVYLTKENTFNISASVNMDRGSMCINLSANMSIRRTVSYTDDLTFSILPITPVVYVKYNDQVYKK